MLKTIFSLLLILRNLPLACPFIYKNYRYLEIYLVQYVQKVIETNFNDNKVAFIECKWRNRLIGKSLLATLKNKSKLINMYQE